MLMAARMRLRLSNTRALGRQSRLLLELAESTVAQTITRATAQVVAHGGGWLPSAQIQRLIPEAALWKVKCPRLSPRACPINDGAENDLAGQPHQSSTGRSARSRRNWEDSGGSISAARTHRQGLHQLPPFQAQDGAQLRFQGGGQHQGTIERIDRIAFERALQRGPEPE